MMITLALEFFLRLFFQFTSFSINCQLNGCTGPLILLLPAHEASATQITKLSFFKNKIETDFYYSSAYMFRYLHIAQGKRHIHKYSMKGHVTVIY